MQLWRHNAPVKLFFPHPLKHPRGHQFFCVAPVFLSLYFYLVTPWLITLIPSFSVPRPLWTSLSSVRPFFVKHIFCLTPPPPGLPGWDKGRTIWPAQNLTDFVRNKVKLSVNFECQYLLNKNCYGHDFDVYGKLWYRTFRKKMISKYIMKSRSENFDPKFGKSGKIGIPSWGLEFHTFRKFVIQHLCIIIMSIVSKFERRRI